MNARPSRPIRWAVAAILAGALSMITSLPAAQADDSEPTKVLLLLDVSGSMNEPIVTGGTKLAAAKRALKQVADALPPGTEVGLRVYGSEIAEPKSRNPKACTDTELVMPLGRWTNRRCTGRSTRLPPRARRRSPTRCKSPLLTSEPRESGCWF